MSEDPLAERIQAALAATHDKPLDAQAHAVRTLVQEPSQSVADNLWQLLVGGLVAAVGIALVGLIVLICLGKSYAPVLTAFTALLTGLIGLFVQAPTNTAASTPK